MKALCVQTTPCPNPFHAERRSREVKLLLEETHGDLVHSFSRAKTLIERSPMSYDAIVSTFSADQMITGRQPSRGKLRRAERLDSDYPLYSIARSFVAWALTTNPFAAVVIYSGAHHSVAEDAILEFGDRIGWVSKGRGDPEADRPKLQTTLLQCLCEYRLVLDDSDAVRVQQQASRSPVLYQSERFPPIAVRPHFGCKRIILPDVLMEFEYLINKKDVSERELQMFLEAHPSFLLGNRYKTMRAHVHLHREEEGKGPLIPDFMLEPVNPFDFWKVVDLKLPGDKIIKIMNDNRKGFSSKILDALHQLREYRDYFDNPRYRERMGEIGITAFRPQISAIIGRDYRSLTIEDVIKARCDLTGLEVITYTELLERAKRMAWLLG